MSEWKAGSDSDVEEVEAPIVRKRLTKAQQQQEDDEAEYDADETPKQRRRAPASPSREKDGPSADGASVYTSVMNFMQMKESSLGVVGPTASSTPARGLTADLATQPFHLAGATMHQHQMSGLNWIKSRFEMGLNCIVADEMGLGKTLTSISFLAYLQELAQPGGGASAAASSSSKVSKADSKVGPYLVLCPLTVLDNWMNELSTFAPTLLVQSYTGSKAEREEIQEDIKAYVCTQPKADRKDPDLPFHVLLTTYEGAMNDVEFLSKFKFRVAIIDEAHRLKNSESILSQTLVHEYNIAFKILLTGTPVQNNLAELWSMLWFLHPKLFVDQKQFLLEFEQLGSQQSRAFKDVQATLSDAERARLGQETLDQLHEIIRPFLLRRIKDECDLDIPPKREIILKTRLTKAQRDIYKNLLLKNYDLIGSGKQQNTRALLNIVHSLRKCCSHPYLFPGVEPEPFEEGPHIYQASGKFALLAKLLRVLKKLKKRVLLFSTSVQTLDIVQDTLSHLGHSYERLDGSVRGEERYQAIERFTKTEKEADETFVFLLSTRAGGVGLNLTCAQVVIFLDADWNPFVDLQAQARAHRIGQRQEVLMIRLVSSNTVEEIIQKRTMRKLLMAHNVLSKGRFNLRKAAATDADDAEAGSAKAAADVDENESLGRSANDLKNILQYGLDHLFGEGADELADVDDGLQEDELEAIVTGKLEKQQAAAAQAAVAAESAMEIDGEEPPAASAAAARAAYNRISSLALPTLEAASLAPAAEDTAEDSVYVFEGKDFKQARLDHLEDELDASAAAGSKALQRLAAAARAANMDEDGLFSDDGYGSPGGDSGRKRKPVTQESYADRALRVQRNKELAQKRLESARKKREEAEVARKVELDAKWSEYEYESSSVQLDDAIEARFVEEAEELALQDAGSQPISDSQNEWGAGDAEEQKSAQPSAASARKAKLVYVVGDATCPFVFQREDGQEGMTSSADEPAAAASSAAASSSSPPSSGSAVVFVPVDASGRWGKGGLFRAMDNRSALIGERYQLAGEMEDLEMGDVHIITLQPDELRAAPSTTYPPQPPAPLHVALCVVLKRGKNQMYGAPSLQPDSLALAFKKLSHYATAHQKSVHLPRIGGNDPNMQWYAIERLLNKHLVARGVQVFAYYFQRQRPQYRSPVKTQLARTSSAFSQRTMSSESSGSISRQLSFQPSSRAPSATRAPSFAASNPIVLDADEVDEPRPAPVTSQLSSLSQFHDVFTSAVIYIHAPSTPTVGATAVTPEDARLLRRYISAYDGELAEGEVTHKVTHIVTSEPFLTPELIALKQRASQRVRVMQLAWVEQSVTAGRLDDSLKWQVQPPPKA